PRSVSNLPISFGSCPGGVSPGLPGPGMGRSRRSIMSRLGGLTCGLVLTALGFAVGQEVIQPRTVTTTPAGPTAELRRVSQILGSSVRLQDGSGYGRVEDIVLSEDGCIEYAVISRENQYALLPWGIANVDYSQRVVAFGVTPQVIQPFFFA